MDNLQSVFDETLKREGKNIIAGDMSIQVFFRRNDSGTTDRYLTMFVPVNQAINQGNTFTLNGVPYLVLKQLTLENNVYQKFICVQTNQHIKFMLKHTEDSSKADLTEFAMYMSDSFGDSVSSSGNILVIDSQAEFKLSLNDLSRRIQINDRFFNEYYGAVWKITDINYKDGIVSLFCERDITNPSDDKENGIANYYDYNNQPETEVGEITINPPYDEDGRYAVIQSDTTTFTASINSIESPEWNITLDAQGIPSGNYESEIDNSNGTFTVTNNKLYKDAYLKYTVQEATSGQTKEYFVELASLF
ncbi:MAG: hypothetical protein KH359_01875 [Clostridiales bacterium]|nr:hypothetical protein [Clostridiales bacterium]